MSTRLVAWSTAALAVACAPSSPAPKSPADLVCPAGTARMSTGDSDVGWGGVERTDCCETPAHLCHGWAIEEADSAPGQPTTKLVGRYANGTRVGTWVQTDARTGAELGRFTLDDAGSGRMVLRDQLGHALDGALVRGARDGEWTHRDRDGRVVAVDVWTRGTYVRRDGDVPWDPPMVSPADMCPAGGAPDDADGCPERGDAGR